MSKYMFSYWAQPFGSNNGWTTGFDCARTVLSKPCQITLPSVASSPGVGVCLNNQTLNPDSFSVGAIYALLPAIYGQPANTRAWQTEYFDSWSNPLLSNIRWYANGYYTGASLSVTAPYAVPLLPHAGYEFFPLQDPVFVPDPEALPLVRPVPQIDPLPPGTKPANDPNRIPGYRFEVGPLAPPLPNYGYNLEVTPGGATGGNAKTPRDPPGRKQRERKMNAKGGAALAALKALRSIAYGATEVNDAVSAVYNALPAALRRRLGLAGGIAAIPAKLSAIYNHLDQLDLNKAVVNLILNEIEDQLIGRAIGRAQGPQAVFGGRSVFGLTLHGGPIDTASHIHPVVPHG